MEKNEPTKESLKQALILIKEQILQLEKDLRTRRATARTLKRLLEQWNQETDSEPSSTT